MMAMSTRTVRGNPHLVRPDRAALFAPPDAAGRAVGGGRGGVRRDAAVRAATSDKNASRDRRHGRRRADAMATTAGQHGDADGSASPAGTRPRASAWTQVAGPLGDARPMRTPPPRPSPRRPSRTATPLTFRFASASSGSASARRRRPPSPSTRRRSASPPSPKSLRRRRHRPRRLYRRPCSIALGDPIAAGVVGLCQRRHRRQFRAARRRPPRRHELFRPRRDRQRARSDQQHARPAGAQSREHHRHVAYLHPDRPDRQRRRRHRAPRRRRSRRSSAHGVSVDRGRRAPATAPGAMSRRRALQPPHHAATRRWRSTARSRGNALLRTRFSPDGTAGARHDQQLRQRHDAVEHLPDHRGELGGLFPPRRRRRRRAHRRRAAQGERLARALRRHTRARAGNYGWSTVVPADAASTAVSRAGTPPPADRRRADGTGDFRHEPFQYGLGGRDRSVRSRLRRRASAPRWAA